MYLLCIAYAYISKWDHVVKNSETSHVLANDHVDLTIQKYKKNLPSV